MARHLQIEDGLFLIPLDQAMTGFTNFIGAWVLKGDPLIVVDVGPASTIPMLVDTLKELDADRPDIILTTHIHIDHSGGLGDFLDHIPDVPIVCHSSAVSHLTAPERLWNGSLKTLGDVARTYGEPKPVPERLLNTAETFSNDAIVPIATPGHAPHHVSYQCGRILFAGEAGGVFMAHSEGLYLRPATPPKFFPETALGSIEKLLEVNCGRMCYGHFGSVKNFKFMLETHRKQLLRWLDIIEGVIETGPADPLAECFSVLMEKDPLLAIWPWLTPEIRERETGFIKNSIKGYLQYFKTRDA